VTQQFSKLSFQRLFLAGVCFLAAIFLLQLLIKEFDSFLTAKTLILAILTILALLGTIGLALTALPGWNYLQVDENGFKLKLGRGSIAHKWQECSRFFAIEKASINSFRKRYCAAVDLLAPTISQKVLKSVSGAHIVFLFDHGVEYSDMVEILNEYRDRSFAKV